MGAFGNHLLIVLGFSIKAVTGRARNMQKKKFDKLHCPEDIIRVIQ
jgi:hypothetical protein